jgi:hypothetical protein
VADVNGAGGLVGSSPGSSSTPVGPNKRHRVEPPLTAAGIASYAGLLPASEITIVGTLPNGNTTGTVTYFVIDTAKNSIVSQVVLPDAAKQNNSVSLILKVPTAAASFAVGTFDSDGNFRPASFLRVVSPSVPSGAVGRSGT